MDNTKQLTVLSLCTGYGGLELGLARALPNPLRVVAVEVEAYALANLVAKAETNQLAVEALWPDLRTFPAERFRGCFDFVLAGYPCQGESVAGKRLGKKDPRWLWPHIARIVQTVRPIWCFFENVPGHLSLGFPTVYRSLRDMGYTVEAGLFSAAECGAPHRRQRLFILANSTGFNDRQRCKNEQGKDETLESRRQTNGGNKKLEPSSSRTSQMADTKGIRFQKTKGIDERQKYQLQNRNSIRDIPLPSSQKWPARPGQPQYEWEEPRVVEYANTKRRQARLQTKNNSKYSEGQTQSRLGREFDGSTYPLDIAKGIRGGYLTKPGGEIGHNMVLEAKQRIDRLRLLGNGVIPQQAEKAFRALTELFSDTKDKS